MSTSLDSVIGKVYSVSKSIFWPSANEIWQPWTTPQAYPLSCHYVWHQTLSFLGWRSLNIEAATTITWVSRIKCWQEIVFVLRTLESCFSYLRNFCDPLQDSWSACNCPISACSRNHPMACTVSNQQPAPLFQEAGRSRQSVRKKSLPDPRNSWKIPVTPVAVLQLCSCCFNPFWLFPLFGLFLLCRLLLQSNAANSWNFNEAEPHMLYVSCGPKLKKKKATFNSIDIYGSKWWLAQHASSYVVALGVDEEACLPTYSISWLISFQHFISQACFVGPQHGNAGAVSQDHGS